MHKVLLSLLQLLIFRSLKLCPLVTQVSGAILKKLLLSKLIFLLRILKYVHKSIFIRLSSSESIFNLASLLLYSWWIYTYIYIYISMDIYLYGYPSVYIYIGIYIWWRRYWPSWTVLRATIQLTLRKLRSTTLISADIRDRLHSILKQQSIRVQDLRARLIKCISN